MFSMQAIPRPRASTGQPTTNVAPTIDPISQYLAFVRSNIVDGAYYVALLQGFLKSSDEPAEDTIECLSTSADDTFRWGTDWRSQTPDNARLCIARGRVSSTRLSELASTFSLSPAFLVGHLGTTITRSPTSTWPICPPLPSQRIDMGHIRFFTLGRRAGNTNRFDFSGMPFKRAECRYLTEDFDLMSQHLSGETRIRAVHLHNACYFSVEQMVSFCFIRKEDEDEWIGVLLTDNGLSLAHHWLLPWRDDIGRSGPCFMPHNSEEDESRQDAQDTASDPHGFELHDEMKWLDKTGAFSIRKDPYLLVGRIVELATISLAKVINVMEEDVASIGSADPAAASDQLRFTLSLLDSLRTYTTDNLFIVKEDDARKRHSVGFMELTKDLEYLRARIEVLSNRCDIFANTLLSNLSIQESHQVNKLTKFAFIYIPLSFVSSVFGMNVMELQKTPPIWIFFVTAIAFTLLSVLVVSWENIREWWFQFEMYCRKLSAKHRKHSTGDWDMNI